jgi:hypothetical protein
MNIKNRIFKLSSNFGKMTILRKVVVVFLVFACLSALSSGAWVGAIVTAYLAYVLLNFVAPTEIAQAPHAGVHLNDDDEYNQQMQELENYAAQKAEQDRLDQENRINQEMLDRLN